MTAETEHTAIIADTADMTEDTPAAASAKADTAAAGPSGAETAKPDTQQAERHADAAEGVYYTVQETAKICKVSERTIWRWIHGGRLAAGKFGRAYRVTGAAINALWTPAKPGEEQRKEEQQEREELEQIANDARIQEYGNDSDEGY